MQDPLHLAFIIAAANARAENYGLSGRRDPEYFKTALPNVMVPDFKPKSGVKIAQNEAEKKQQEEEARNSMVDVDGQAAAILKDLPAPSSLAGTSCSPYASSAPAMRLHQLKRLGWGLLSLDIGLAPTEDNPYR
jgi:ubiquitin-activating enzyme E1